MEHGTSPIPAPLSHPRAYQKSMLHHHPYPPDLQPACFPSTQPRDILQPKPKKREPLAIYPTALNSKSTPRLRRRRHIIPSHVNCTLIISVHHSPAGWAPSSAPPSTSTDLSFFLFLWAFRFFLLYTSYRIYTSKRGWMTVFATIFSCALPSSPTHPHRDSPSRFHNVLRSVSASSRL